MIRFCDSYLQHKGGLLTTYDIVLNNLKSLQDGYDFSEEGSEDSVTWDYMILDELYFVRSSPRGFIFEWIAKI